jgi:hypothetical protein
MLNLTDTTDVEAPDPFDIDPFDYPGSDEYYYPDPVEY